MNGLTKLALKRLSRTARPYLKSAGLLQVSGVYNRSALVFEPGAERVVALAPHMDDETIGCGGTLALHARRGAQVSVVFLTDGRHGSSALATLPAEQRAAGERALVATRKREARAALAKLGLSEPMFLDAEDGALAECAWAAAGLRAILLEHRPELVYLPFYLEEHRDHRATSRVLLDAVAGTPLDFECAGYEVWTPLFPNCLVRIDETMPIKKEALAQYESQLADADYLHASVGLNMHRSIGLLGSRGGYAEAFHVSSLRDFREQHARYGAAE
ncbi:MAG TPA: PIG-L deacetylase family protein [Gammaproteobacteria bacterium]|nr:PIG-L deacetylase family protein [Gammaproteobacteria bacterium]